MRLLLFDDNLQFSAQVSRFLQGYGIVCDTVNSASEGLSRVFSSGQNNLSYDLLIVTSMLPDASGLDVVRQCRRRGYRVPILLLSSISNPDENYKAFAAGADDVVSSPVSFKELLARIYALVRRSLSHSSSVIKTGKLSLDMESRSVYVGDQLLPLTKKEYMVLELLFLRKGMTIMKQVFLHHLYEGPSQPGRKIVDVFLCKIRKKLEEYTGQEEYIKTVWSMGYKLLDIAPVVEELSLGYDKSKVQQNTSKFPYSSADILSSDFMNIKFEEISNAGTAVAA